MKKPLTFLLIHPEMTRSKYTFVGVIEDECLELEYISTMLSEAGHRPVIFDVHTESISVRSAILRHSPDVVYLYGQTRQESFILEYCETAKSIDSRIVTVVGGNHVQLVPERLYHDCVDYILTSYDIFKLLDIADYEFGEKRVDLNKLDSLCRRENGVWRQNPSLPFDINRLPLPDRTYFYRYPDHYPYLELRHAAWVRTAFCCPYRCKFCLRNKMNCGSYSARDIQSVVDEIESIQTENIYLIDDDFLFDEKRVREFIDTVRARKLQKTFICYGRADFIAAHEELMRDFKEIGLYYVLVGLEAFEDRYLDSYNKRSDMENNLKAIDICKRCDINMMAMFILDLDFTGKDFKALYRWIKAHDLTHVAVSIFTPEMGTELFEEYKDRLITDNPADYDYMHLVVKPTKLSVRRYYFHYYILLVKLFFKGQRDGIYKFLNYKKYIRYFLRDIFKPGKDNEKAKETTLR